MSLKYRAVEFVYGLVAPETTVLMLVTLVPVSKRNAGLSQFNTWLAPDRVDLSVGEVIGNTEAKLLPIRRLST